MKYILTILLITLFITTGCSQVDPRYQTDIDKTYDKILSSSDNCLKSCQTFSNTWNNAIKYNKDIDTEIQINKAFIQNSGIYKMMDYHKKDIDQKMIEVSKPPKSYEKAHDKLVEMYSIYSQLYSLALNPNGSYVSYNNTVNDLQNKLTKTSSEFKVLLP